MVDRAMLGLSVSQSCVRAVLQERRGICWAGTADYANDGELSEAIARLASEAGRPVRVARVVLERDVVQLRTIIPAPPLKPRALRRYVALEAPRLFRKNGSPLVTDATILGVPGSGNALLAAATTEHLVQAILAGCDQAGLRIAALCPASDVLPAIIAPIPTEGEVRIPNGGTSEVLAVGPEGTWRSRLVSGTGGAGVMWAGPLAALQDRAAHFAPAYAGLVGRPRLELFPAGAKAARERASRRRLARVATLGILLWLVAGAVYVGRLVWMLRQSTHAIVQARPALDSALGLRRDLDAGRTTLETIAAARSARSRTVALLAGVTAALDDSAYVVALTLTPDGIVRLAGLAPSAARVVSELEGVPQLEAVKLEGPVTRETTASGQRDRFAIVGHLEPAP